MNIFCFPCSSMTEGKPNIFGLWTKQDIWEYHLGLRSASFTIFSTTKKNRQSQLQEAPESRQLQTTANLSNGLQLGQRDFHEKSVHIHTHTCPHSLSRACSRTRHGSRPLSWGSALPSEAQAASSQNREE